MTNSAATSIDSLSRQGRELLDESNPSHAHHAFRRWDAEVADWLDGKYPDSGLSAEWGALPSSSLVTGGSYSSDPTEWALFRFAVATRLQWLGRLGKARRVIDATQDARKLPNPNGKVFIVHGRNNAVRDAVARFLETIGVKTVILHEQPNKGRTLIEKFVDHSDVAFAVVLLTGDDRCRLASEDVKQEKPRPRQNVILELGFFLGRIGRDRVCALYEEGTEIPSDYDGVAFVKYDTGGGWRIELARELKAAGIPVNLNDAI